MTHPFVSIIIPTRNSARTLRECLKSIKNQSYQNTEIIVVDNNSTDSTKQIARTYTDKVLDVASYDTPNKERSSQRNQGARNSEGEYLLFIDSDMTLSPDVIKECVEKVSFPTPIGNPETSSNRKNTIKALVIPEDSVGEGFWAQCKALERSFYIGVDWMEAARFFRKDAFLEVGGYDETLTSGEDWDLSQRIEKRGKIDRISDFIHHNEGRINLIKTMKKKYYYAKEFAKYTNKKEHTDKQSKQTGILTRYALFFSKPKAILCHPLSFLGMLFMKTCEFTSGGIGYLTHKKR